ncbi:MAG: hemerythrin domain-containing protein [Legionellaceae bacterium]|nr:hemerythrin domain-containing protein [Legionellaceae bacterium]
MNAIDFLIKEHNRVRTMFVDISDESHHYDTQKKKFAILSDDLLRHEKMEHEVWYPHFKSKVSDTVKHLLVEEKNAEKAIKKLDNLKTEAAWKEGFLKLKDDVEHHAREEENDLFPEVRTILSEKELEEIGKTMYEFKKNHS